MTWKLINEIARKSVHILAILLIVIYYYALKYYDKQIALMILTAILIFFLIFEFLRLEVKIKSAFLRNIWSYLKRNKEKNRMGGEIFLILGVIISLAVFDFRIALAAILMTTIGDLSAALIGKRFGKHFFMKERAWEGTIAEFSVNIIIGIFIFILFAPILSLTQAWTIILVMALTATIVETFIYTMDDNLMIPLFSGFLGQLALLLTI